MTPLESKGEDGFIALITAIILSAILITVTISLNQIGYLTRSEIADAEYKDRSSALAEACADTALLRIAEDPLYVGPETVTLSTGSCSIVSVALSGSIYTIRTSAIFPSPATTQSATTNLVITADSATIAVTSWNEVP